MTTWEKGKYARVGLNIERSFNEHGSAERMHDMKGKEYLIESARGATIILRYNSERSFYFSKCDLHLVDGDDDIEIEYPKPESFDPANLVT